MPIRVGINGFGRIGRSLFRVLRRREDVQVVAINDICSGAQLASLLQYDSIMGVLPGPVEATDALLRVGAQQVRLSAHRDPSQIGWGALDVDVVVESTGRFGSRADLQRHLAGGARRVLLTVPPQDSVDAMVVMGVNDAVLRREHALVSAASCTTNCLAPLAQVLDAGFGIEAGLMTTVHAYTNDQRLVDRAHKDLRRSRAAAENIIPTTTGAARAVGKILPQLQGRLDGIAARVPVIDGSLIDLVLQLRAPATAEAINQAVQAAAHGALRGILAYSDAPLVVRDIVGNPHSCIFDAPLTQCLGGGHARVVAWYDNEWGYSNRCAELIARLGTLGPVPVSS